MEYAHFLDDYEKLGHMNEIVDTEMSEDGYFIPHHPVFKQDNHTTKLRMVFDASSKTSNGISLNDILLIVSGPSIQKDLFSIITRFRTHRYAITADIEKMYRQVKLPPEDVKYQRILWRDNPDKAIKVYQLNTNLRHGSSVLSGGPSFETISGGRAEPLSTGERESARRLLHR